MLLLVFLECGYLSLHKLLFGALGADDVVTIGDEASAYQASLARSAEEAIVVPMPVFEGDEFGAADTGDGFAASEAAFGEEFAETFGAVGFVISAGEASTS